MAEGPRGGVWIVGHGSERARIMVEDRSGRAQVVDLAGWQARLYLACDRIQGRNGVLATVAGDATEADIDAFLAACIRGRLMVSIDGRYLSLGVYRPAIPVDLPRDTAAELPMAVAGAV
jgi:hypothetical protein